MQLSTKITAITLGMLALAVWSTVVGLISAQRLQTLLERMTTSYLVSVQAAEELEIALLEQRGYVSSYMLDHGNREWLEKLEAVRPAFHQWLATARETAHTESDLELLQRLEQVYERYAEKRNEAIATFDGGDSEGAREILLGPMFQLYRDAYDLCEEFIDANNEHIDQAVERTRAQVEMVALLETVTVLSIIVLGSMLLVFYFRGVIQPLRQMAADVRGFAAHDQRGLADSSADELRQVGSYLQRLMADVTETRSDLEQSRIRLASAEKLASVGKLAASVAHEIRNPLTAIKMWLFSLRRSVAQTSETQKKFDVVSEEIHRLEDIIRNFLEFSRPPELQLSLQPISALLDKTLELMHYRLTENRIQVLRQEQLNLPPVLVDPEQLKQVFLNLLGNALEAMPPGGEIRIQADMHRRGEEQFVVVRVADNGPGMADEVRARIFEPFFTTKEKGTGLGLCIAAAVMARHRGALKLESNGKPGTTLAVWIPVAGPPAHG